MSLSIMRSELCLSYTTQQPVFLSLKNLVFSSSIFSPNFIINYQIQVQKQLFDIILRYIEFFLANYYIQIYIHVLITLFILQLRLQQIINMKNEIIQQKQKIIDHIQVKLAQLRAKRHQLQQRKYPQNVKSFKLTRPSSAKAQKPNQIEKVQLQNNLQQLQRLYEAKKQLKNIGIITNNPQQIYKYQTDQKWVNHIQRKKEKAIKDTEKMKIINQEMIKTQNFLKSKKVATKKLALLQQMNYRHILKQKQEQLNNYENLVLKNKLSRVQKQQLIEKTFELLKQWNKVIRKQVLKKFLLANPQFCSHFYITHAQINRDLEVLETKELNVLDQRQFLQFVKSIQVTNPNIQPSVKRQLNKQKNKRKQMLKQINIENMVQNQSSQLKNKEKQKVSGRQYFRKLLQYMRRIFKNFDKSNESVVERSKFVSAIQKGLYLDKTKQKIITLQQLKNLAAFMHKKTKQKGATSYYKQLDAKFINFGQIQSFCKQYCLKFNKNDNKEQEDKLTMSNQKIQQQSQFEEQSNDGKFEQSSQVQERQQEEICLSDKQGKVITEEDYRRYGWHRDQNNQTVEDNGQKSVNTKIKQLDKYYEDVRNKYGNQIAFNDLHSCYEYKQDFKQLQAFIKSQHNKHTSHQQHHKHQLSN